MFMIHDLENPTDLFISVRCSASAIRPSMLFLRLLDTLLFIIPWLNKFSQILIATERLVEEVGSGVLGFQTMRGAFVMAEQ